MNALAKASASWAMPLHVGLALFCWPGWPCSTGGSCWRRWSPYRCSSTPSLDAVFPDNSVVDLDLIDGLYERAYQERVRSGERLRILNASRLVDLTERPGGVRAVVEFLPTRVRSPVHWPAPRCFPSLDGSLR